MSDDIRDTGWGLLRLFTRPPTSPNHRPVALWGYEGRRHLPTDLARCILTYLCDRQRMMLCRLNYAWMDLICHSPTVWETFTVERLSTRRYSRSIQDLYTTTVRHLIFDDSWNRERWMMDWLDASRLCQISVGRRQYSADGMSPYFRPINIPVWPQCETLTAINIHEVVAKLPCGSGHLQFDGVTELSEGCFLKRLQYHHHMWSSIPKSYGWPPRLMHLSLHAVCTPYQLCELPASLTALELSITPDKVHLLAIDLHCCAPRLETFIIRYGAQHVLLWPPLIVLRDPHSASTSSSSSLIPATRMLPKLRTCILPTVFASAVTNWADALIRELGPELETLTTETNTALTSCDIVWPQLATLHLTTTPWHAPHSTWLTSDLLRHFPRLDTILLDFNADTTMKTFRYQLLDQCALVVASWPLDRALDLSICLDHAESVPFLSPTRTLPHSSATGTKTWWISCEHPYMFMDVLEVAGQWDVLHLYPGTLSPELTRHLHLPLSDQDDVAVHLSQPVYLAYPQLGQALNTRSESPSHVPIIFRVARSFSNPYVTDLDKLRPWCRAPIYQRSKCPYVECRCGRQGLKETTLQPQSTIATFDIAKLKAVLSST
jgi:hypothetical protein